MSLSTSRHSQAGREGPADGAGGRGGGGRPWDEAAGPC